jgi:hypothetical protein
MIIPHLPKRFVHGIECYLEHGILPGSFLTAVLENDLKEAFGRADSTSVRELPGLVAWIYNNIPVVAWGSPDRVANYVKAIREAKAEVKRMETESFAPGPSATVEPTDSFGICLSCGKRTSASLDCKCSNVDC